MMYDIIGDIHGHADTLEILLSRLGYRRRFGVYKHRDGRHVVFVGDFIDRGPKIRETLHLVRDMVESGNALAVMGNHEFNAISFHTPHIEKGGFFRQHTIKEIKQHIETLDQFSHYDHEFQDFLDWFKTLPLYREFDTFRVVHACWDNEHISFLKQNFSGITPGFLRLANDKPNNKINKGSTYWAVEETLKGKEEKLPNGVIFRDKDGNERTEARVKWWAAAEERKKYKDVLMECPKKIAEDDIPENQEYYSYTDTKPVFFGHYWLKGEPKIDNPSAICLDYSVARGGQLVACRMNEDGMELISQHVV
jgi:Calcineurin-like phosphoesterase